MPQLAQIAVQHGVINKVSENDKETFRLLAKDWINSSLTLEQLVAHINDGYPFCAQHTQHRKKENFTCSNILTVDIDDGWKLPEALADPFIQQYAAIVYTTPSHCEANHRFRLMFLLDRCITDKEEMHAALTGIIRKFGGDGSCKDACRMFFGSKGSNPILLGNTLPNDELDKILALGNEPRYSDIDRDHDEKSSPTRKSVATRSAITLDPDQVVRLANGTDHCLQKLPAKEVIYCPVHLDRHPSAMVTANKQGTRGVYCSACSSTFWPVNTSYRSRQAFDFDHIPDLIRQLASEDFPYHHDDLYNMDDNGVLIEPTAQEIEDRAELMANRSHITLFSKFLPDQQLKPGVMFVRSPKGSGKTEQLVKIVQQCRDQELSVLLIGHRQTLIHSMAARLGLTCYMYFDNGQQRNNRPEPYYAICVDSMSKLLKPVTHKYDVVILDESDQVISHFTADTLRSKRRHCYQMAFHYLRSAQTVIACDADLSAITVTGLMQCVPLDSPYRFYLNDYHPSMRTFDLYNDENHLVADMLEAIGNGGRYFISTNSKRKAKTLHEVITRKLPDKQTMLLTSEQSANDDAQHFINNIKTEILKYDVTIASPTLGTGIDITFEDAAPLIDTVYGFFVARVNTHFDIDQQLARVRHPKAVKVWITPERFSFETDPSAIEAELLSCRNLNDLITGFTRDGTPELDQAYLAVYSHVTAMQRASKNDLKKNFQQLREQNGWIAKNIEPNKEDSAIGREKIAEATSIIKKREIQAICDATPITDDEYRQLSDLSKTHRLAQADEVSMRHYELSSFYRDEVTPSLVAEDDDGALRKKIRLAEVFFGSPDLIQERHRKLEDNSALASDAMLLPLKQQVLRDVFAAAGVAQTDGTIVTNVVIKQDDLHAFVESVRLYKRKFEELFGVKIRRDLEQKSVQSLGVLLDLIGLELKKTANYKVDGKRINEYQINAESVKFVQDIIQRRASNSLNPSPIVEMAWRDKTGKKKPKPSRGSKSLFLLGEQQP